MTKTPDFQETLKRMLETPPKENKTLTEQRNKTLTKSQLRRRNKAPMREHRGPVVSLQVS